jgi:hypothetical protein
MLGETVTVNIKQFTSFKSFIYFILLYKGMSDDTIPRLFISAFCSAGSDRWRRLALVLPTVPCRKAVAIVDYSGAGAVVSNIVVHKSWRQG